MVVTVFAIGDVHLELLAVGIVEYYSKRPIGILESRIGDPIIPPSFSTYMAGSRMNNCRQMADYIIMGVECVRFVVVGDVYGTIASLATSIQVGTPPHVEHEIPYDGSDAMLVHCV